MGGEQPSRSQLRSKLKQGTKNLAGRKQRFARGRATRTRGGGGGGGGGRGAGE